GQLRAQGRDRLGGGQLLRRRLFGFGLRVIRRWRGLLPRQVLEQGIEVGGQLLLIRLGRLGLGLRLRRLDDLWFGRLWLGLGLGRLGLRQLGLGLGRLGLWLWRLRRRLRRLGRWGWWGRRRLLRLGLLR